MSIMSTVGFGDITPQTNYEILFVIFSMLFSSAIFAYVLTYIGEIILEQNREREGYKKQIFLTKQYLEGKNVSLDIKNQALNYLSYKFKNDNQLQLDEYDEILEQFPSEFQNKIIKSANMQIIEKCQLFQQFSEETKEKLSIQLKSNYYLQNTIIFKKGQIEQDPLFYFIEKGEVDLYIQNFNNQSIIQHLYSSQSFGELSFLNSQARDVNAKVIKSSMIYYLSQEQTIQILKQNDKDFQHFCIQRDRLNQQFSSTKQSIQCIGCQSSNHILQQCRYLNLQPNRKHLIFKYNINVYQERQYKKRNIRQFFYIKDTLKQKTPSGYSGNNNNNYSNNNFKNNKSSFENLSKQVKSQKKINQTVKFENQNHNFSRRQTLLYQQTIIRQQKSNSVKEQIIPNKQNNQLQNSVGSIIYSKSGQSLLQNSEQYEVQYPDNVEYIVNDKYNDFKQSPPNFQNLDILDSKNCQNNKSNSMISSSSYSSSSLNTSQQNQEQQGQKIHKKNQQQQYTYNNISEKKISTINSHSQFRQQLDTPQIIDNIDQKFNSLCEMEFMQKFWLLFYHDNELKLNQFYDQNICNFNNQNLQDKQSEDDSLYQENNNYKNNSTNSYYELSSDDNNKKNILNISENDIQDSQVIYKTENELEQSIFEYCSMKKKQKNKIQNMLSSIQSVNMQLSSHLYNNGNNNIKQNQHRQRKQKKADTHIYKQTDQQYPQIQIHQSNREINLNKNCKNKKNYNQQLSSNDIPDIAPTSQYSNKQKRLNQLQQQDSIKVSSNNSSQIRNKQGSMYYFRNQIQLITDNSIIQQYKQFYNGFISIFTIINEKPQSFQFYHPKYNLSYEQLVEKFNNFKKSRILKKIPFTSNHIQSSCQIKSFFGGQTTATQANLNFYSNNKRLSSFKKLNKSQSFETISANTIQRKNSSTHNQIFNQFQQQILEKSYKPSNINNKDQNHLQSSIINNNKNLQKSSLFKKQQNDDSVQKK